VNTTPPISATPGGSTPPPPRRRTSPRPSLYVTILSLAVAAIAATWLPFSVLYISALSKRPVTTSALTAPQSHSPGSTAPAASITPLTTRAS
jgi:hypothetical protein